MKQIGTYIKEAFVTKANIKRAAKTQDTNTVIIDSTSEYEEYMTFYDGAKVDETEIQRLWKKMKGDKDKFATAVFDKYPDVYEIQHTFSNKEYEGEFIERETGKWMDYSI